MDDRQSWRSNLELLKRMPRPSKSQQTPRRTSRSLDSYIRIPRTAPVDPRSVPSRRPSDFFLKALDKNALEFSYKPIKDVERFKDSPTPDLPHRPHQVADSYTTAGLSGRIAHTKFSCSKNEFSTQSANHSPRYFYTSKSMNDISHRGYVVTREMIRFKLFHRHITDPGELRYIPECLDTTSEFYNPRVSADERFDKYLEEMRRVNAIETPIRCYSKNDKI